MYYFDHVINNVIRLIAICLPKDTKRVEDVMFCCLSATKIEGNCLIVGSIVEKYLFYRETSYEKFFIEKKYKWNKLYNCDTLVYSGVATVKQIYKSTIKKSFFIVGLWLYEGCSL